MVAPPTIAGRAGNARWTVVFWMFVISAVSYLDRNNFSIAASSVKAEFALNDVQLGGVFSAFVLGYALTQPIAGRIADALGPYRVVAFAIAWWGLFTALTPLVPPGIGLALPLLIAVRCLLGIGEAVIFPASNRLVSNWIPSSERGFANGLIFAGVGIGGGVAPPLVTYIMITFGWRWAFYLSAAIGFVVGLIWLIVVRDRPEQSSKVGPAELALIRRGLPAAADAAAPRARWLDVAKDRQVLLLTGSYFCYGYVAYIFFSWFFIYLSTVRGLNLKSSAIFAMLPFVAMTVFSTLGGILSDGLTARFGKRVGRCAVAGLGMTAAALFVALATQVADARLASLVLAGGAGALYVAQSAYWALSADMGGRASGAVSGLMNMGAQLGGVVTASTTALIAHQFGWTASFLSAAAVCLAGALAWIFVDPDHRIAIRTKAWAGATPNPPTGPARSLAARPATHDPAFVAKDS
jgi:ACS family glucarate transporter-like MFS transporter